MITQCPHGLWSHLSLSSLSESLHILVIFLLGSPRFACLIRRFQAFVNSKCQTSSHCRHHRCQDQLIKIPLIFQYKILRSVSFDPSKGVSLPRPHSFREAVHSICLVKGSAVQRTDLSTQRSVFLIIPSSSSPAQSQPCSGNCY